MYHSSNTIFLLYILKLNNKKYDIPYYYVVVCDYFFISKIIILIYKRKLKIMELKQNINRVHGDLTNYFENVQISEKSNKELGNYFELSVLENNKEVKAIIKMTEIENANFSWEYYANPLDENSLVERVSSIYTFSSDVQDIFEKNRFSSDYLNQIK
jgi:hypothetical protein